MTPVVQTLVHDPSLCPEQCETQQIGNCLQAAVASLLDLPLHEVPHFVDEEAYDGLHWWTHWRRWCRDRDLVVLAAEPEPGEYYLAGGPSPRGHGLHHVCVYRDDEMVWDPHPAGGGLATVERHWVIRPSVEGGTR